MTLYKGCACKFLYGDDTEEEAQLLIEEALEQKTELQTEVKFYKKNSESI